MNAYILRNGNAIRESKITNVTLTVDGFLSSFVVIETGKKYSYYRKDDKSGVEEGYYDEYKLSEYISKNLKTDNVLQRPKSFASFDYAQTGDMVNVRTADLSSNVFYTQKEYVFSHTVGKNYLLSYEKLNFSMMGNATINQTHYSPLVNKFYSKHIAKLSQIEESKKNKYLEYTIYSALRINQIIDEVFPTITANPNNISLNNLNQLINDLKAAWENDQLNYGSISSESCISYYSDLTSFYITAKKYFVEIQNYSERDRISLLINILKSVINNTTVQFKIQYLKDILDKELSENDVNSIVYLAMSFSETQQNEIDAFLGQLVGGSNYVCVNEELFQNDAEKYRHQRFNITLYEAIVRKLDGLQNKLWYYSPLYKYVHAKFVQDEGRESTPLHMFVMSIYALWTYSKYNPYRNNTYNDNVVGFKGNQDDVNKLFKYTRNTATTLKVEGRYTYPSIDFDASPLIINVSEYFIYAASKHFTSMRTSFCFADKIVVECNDYKQFKFTGGWMTPAQYEYKRDFYSYGYYHLFQPIQVLNISDNKVDVPVHEWDINNVVNKTTFIPAFLYHHMESTKYDELYYSIYWLPVVAAWKAAREIIPLVGKVADKLDDLLDVTEDIYDSMHPKAALEFIHDYALTH
ncbi:hypothetical protein [Chryseobacterium paridis]|uniref:DUF2357 domain-containing protein n=1 Tax=Chryseobacterium paridis TaxID=2800328 RepID=A0ABS1FXY6_9FLAO|nr:hypothetical protein [Chryseobacterium paridis]MBK1897279.1 hypothetical protein [Chryseobacterium paridis]